MKKLKVILIVLGIVLIASPYFYHSYSIYRLIILLLGIVILIVGLSIYKKKLIIKVPLYFVGLIGVSFALDYFNFILFSAPPIMTYKVISSDKVSTYNSFFYRIYDCDGKYTIDGYDKNYLCGDEDVETISINKFLENPSETYNKYKNKFVRLEGKIGTIIGASALSLNAYTEAEEVKNGYVTFDQEKVVVVNELEINPGDYFNYDFVDVIGKVSKFEDKEVQTIYLEDAIIVDNHIYDNYELIVNNIYTDDAIKADDIYYVGITSIFYKYREDLLYELHYLLSDKRETIDNLIKDIEPEIVNDNDKVYKLEDYQIILCNNKKTLLVNNRINYYDNICEIEEN